VCRQLASRRPTTPTQNSDGLDKALIAAFRPDQAPQRITMQDNIS